MADLQAEIELTVELRKFFNIDLFVQGYYQIRIGIKFAPKIQAATKIEIKSELSSILDESNEQIYPACIFNDCGVSKTFLIIYKNAEVELDDQFNFKLSVIVDAQNITDCFNRMDIQLCLELYFMEKEYSPERIGAMQSLCSRSYKLHFNPRLGLHTHVPILFDYFHLSALTATIHGSLLCLIPPYVFDRPNVRHTSLFSFLFGQDLSQITTDQLNPTLLDRAYHLHNNICEILLSSYESLQDFYEKMIQHLSAHEQKPIHHHQNCRQRLKELSDKLKTTDDIHSIDNLAHAHIAQCSAENIMLWCQFIQTFGLHEITAIVLAKDYHFKRVKRLSEGFFLRETSRINILINEGDLFNDIHELVRNSLYYSRLPHLPIECIELDGVSDTLPILIEEIYSPNEQPSTTTTIISSLNPTNNNDNTVFQRVQNLSQLNSKLSHSVSEKLNEIRSNSASNILSSPRSQSKKQQQQRTTTSPTKSNSNNTSSTLVRHQSAKTFSFFRNHTQKNINSVVALSNEPFVKLTSIRKVDQDNVSSSPTLKSHTSPAFGLFPNQSDSGINVSRDERFDSSCISTKTSHQSLPNVSIQRSNSSISSVNSNVIDSSIVPTFLCSTSDKVDDDVFQTSDQNNIVAASTFGDSSTKSKVLRASYRGKPHTMDRQTRISNAVRSSSTSSTTYNKHSSNTQPKYFITKTDDKITATTPNQPVNYALDSVLSLTLELEQTATANVQRRHTISAHDINPLLLNGLTDDENQLNLIERANQQNSSIIVNNEPTNATDNKQDISLEYDRLQNKSINSQTIEFVVYKEKLKQLLSSKCSANFMFFSDFSTPISMTPYFYQEIVPFDTNGIHLIICVHGLDGNSGDLRLMKTYLELCLPSCQFDFLMSSSNHSSTFDDIDVMVKQLIEEIDSHIERSISRPQRISFIGHSLGNLIIRATVSNTRFERYRSLLYTYLSLSGPHLGTLFNTSGLVNIGMWLMQKWKKSSSLSQMSFSDHIDPKQTYLYKLSKQPCLEFFKNILMVASPQDRYVPFHSARIEVCKAALKDTSYGSIYVEMISNLLEPILRNPSITFVRYNAFHSIPSGTNNIIGRAAHIAILDSELFVEKLILVSAAKYFK
ncbi:unnamed protein product [Rotaria socialis]|uniref:DUF676 domain-containing protein n=1 Tax=Rotaria socialis TaxID=392032 RepID=A0A817P977_9BILA|nr:unnamed protein product [Rotaria socialis]CAF3407870.1 unnamed protein product [Rotaria socialis]CAF4089380.1 unnamed protein product [Rotaria socialis]CAF4284378.1 unnamed protein product [Rotaria socialis]